MDSHPPSGLASVFLAIRSSHLLISTAAAAMLRCVPTATRQTDLLWRSVGRSRGGDIFVMAGPAAPARTGGGSCSCLQSFPWYQAAPLFLTSVRTYCSTGVSVIGIVFQVWKNLINWFLYQLIKVDISITSVSQHNKWVSQFDVRNFAKFDKLFWISHTTSSFKLLQNSMNKPMAKGKFVCAQG